MADVARLAGVSSQTVSRVVNDELTVASRTRLRVLAAIEEMQIQTQRRGQDAGKRTIENVGCHHSG